jgi:predicted acyltransferase
MKPAQAPIQGSERLLSLDVFRGATIAAMLLVNNPGDWNAVYSQLDHAAWNGWTFTDLIFPFFLWIVGAAIPFSIGRRLENGEPRQKVLARIARRSAIIIALGLLLNGFPAYHFSTMRLPGVLQRIGVCYFFAGLIYLNTRARGQAAAILALLAGYWLLMALAPVPGWGRGILNEHGNFSEYVDTLLLRGHTWRETKTYDPEGVVSTLPAVATVLFGILAGHLLRSPLAPAEKTAWLFVAGNFLLLAGAAMSCWLPINKKLWTSSYAVFMAGMAANVFAVCHWLADVKGWRAWCRPLAIYGMNAITVFVLTGLLGRISVLVPAGTADGHPIVLKTWLFGHLKSVFEAVAGPLATPRNCSLLYALIYVAMMYAVAWIMYRRKWFLRI